MKDEGDAHFIWKFSPNGSERGQHSGQIFFILHSPLLQRVILNEFGCYWHGERGRGRTVDNQRVGVAGL